MNNLTKYGGAFFLALASVWFVPTCTEARKSLHQVHVAWESLMGNRLILTYYNMGLLNDLYRGRVYSSQKVKRYLTMLNAMISEEKRFMNRLQLPHGRKNRLLIRKIRGAVDLMHLASQAFLAFVNEKQMDKQKQFLLYRNAVARDISQVFHMKTLKKKRRYPGGRQAAYRNLGHYLGSDLALAYLYVGMVADAYFNLFFKKDKALGLLGIPNRLMWLTNQQVKQLVTLVPPPEHPYLQKIQLASLTLYQQGKTLKTFIETRNRLSLLHYQKLRKYSWQRIQFLRGS